MRSLELTVFTSDPNPTRWSHIRVPITEPTTITLKYPRLCMQIVATVVPDKLYSPRGMTFSPDGASQSIDITYTEFTKKGPTAQRRARWRLTSKGLVLEVLRGPRSEVDPTCADILCALHTAANKVAATIDTRASPRG